MILFAAHLRAGNPRRYFWEKGVGGTVDPFEYGTKQQGQTMVPTRQGQEPETFNDEQDRSDGEQIEHEVEGWELWWGSGLQ